MGRYTALKLKDVFLKLVPYFFPRVIFPYYSLDLYNNLGAASFY